MTPEPERLDWNEFRPIKPNEPIDTRHLLYAAEAAEILLAHSNHISEEIVASLFIIPVQGNIQPGERLNQARRVYRYWPMRLLRKAIEYNAPWRTLTGPPSWKDIDRDSMVKFFFGHIRQKRWPTVDQVQVKGGRASNHRYAYGEVQGQETLDLGGGLTDRPAGGAPIGGR